jgi:hypothetical protein
MGLSKNSLVVYGWRAESFLLSFYLNLQELTYFGSRDTGDASTSFIDACQNAGRPVTLVHYNPSLSLSESSFKSETRRLHRRAAKLKRHRYLNPAPTLAGEPPSCSSISRAASHLPFAAVYPHHDYDLFGEDFATPNIPQEYGSPMDIYMYIFVSCRVLFSL